MNLPDKGFVEIRIAGFGGQGVILAANIIGKAAALFGGGFATLTQNYGPEARGGASSAALVISDTPVLYPYPVAPDILVVLAQEAYLKFVPEMNPKGILLVEQDLVRLEELPPSTRVFGLPATRLAEDLGKRIVMNVVTVGFFAAKSGILPRECYERAIVESVPAAARDLNLKAFDVGYQYGVKQVDVPGAELETLEAIVE